MPTIKGTSVGEFKSECVMCILPALTKKGPILLQPLLAKRLLLRQERPYLEYNKSLVIRRTPIVTIQPTLKPSKARIRINLFRKGVAQC